VKCELGINQKSYQFFSCCLDQHKASTFEKQNRKRICDKVSVALNWFWSWSVCGPVMFAHHQCGLEPKTSMVLTEEVVSEVSLPDDSVKQSSHFHMHGSHFLSVACLFFPFLLASAVLACLWRSR